jgi:hypothetical protein
MSCKSQNLAEFSGRHSLVVLARLLIAVIAMLCFAGFAGAQTRDFLTEPEVELVRENQVLDKRTDVFIKAIDRRFAIISGKVQAPAKKTQKDEEKWGSLPNGSRIQLLGDIAGILEAAISNIDDVSMHDEKSPLISRSLRKLTAASNGYLTQLNALKQQTKDDDEHAAIERALNFLGEIIEAGNKLPAPLPEKKKDKP